ncbi:hypothetical protein K227x_20250 [Rubripirellula lacrimiformis]|uniref:Uncharacterized protein n=1 Tax=Rubripirellula lacrimiformis TaxID=1930273 RepID=A0A517N938_9BACT|nr:hypothetical protein K227x_20250 [Rubripirellula lacrimiformis]
MGTRLNEQEQSGTEHAIRALYRLTAWATPRASTHPNARPDGHTVKRAGAITHRTCDPCPKSFNHVGNAPCVHAPKTRGPMGTR